MTNLLKKTEEEIKQERKSIIFNELRMLVCKDRNDFGDRIYRCPVFQKPRRKLNPVHLLQIPEAEVKVEILKNGIAVECGFWRLSIPDDPSRQEEFTLSIVVDDSSRSCRKVIYAPSNVRAYVQNYYGVKGYKEFRRAVMSTFDVSLTKIMAKLKEVRPELYTSSLTCDDKAEQLMARVPGVRIINHHAVIDFADT